MATNTTRTRRRSSPAPPKFKEFEERLKSFKDVIWPTEIHANPQNLSNAGFYYIGPIDRVKCAFCGGKLKKWLINDSPVEEHILHFPDCSFVKQFVKVSDALLKPNLRSPNTLNDYISSEELMLKLKKPQTIKMSDYELAISTLKKMGKKQAIIEKATIKCNIKLLSLNLENLLKTIQLLERNIIFSANDENYISNQDDDDDDEEKTKNEYIQELETYINKLHSEKDELQLSITLEKESSINTTITCKVCLENKADTLFLLCRHFATCRICANQLKDCPICRENIMGTVDVYT